jgi:hypothetical protein
MAVFLGATAALRHDWLLDADWGTRYLAAAVFIFCPAVTATVAYDVVRRVRPTLGQLSLGAPRGYTTTLMPALATLCWVMLASLFSWLVIWVLVVGHGGVGPRDMWVYVETLIVYGAAAAVGAVVGRLIAGIPAVVVGAGATLGAAILLGGQGLLVFQVVSSTGTMIGLDRAPVRGALMLALHVGIVAVCILGLWLIDRSAGSGVLTAAIIVPLVPLVALAFVLPETRDEFVPTKEPLVCQGQHPIMCGPASASRLLRKAQADFSTAESKLANSGLILPDRIYVARGPAAQDLADQGTYLSYDPSSLVNGHLPRSTIANTLGTPRLCGAFFDSRSAPEYLSLVDTVSDWMLASLSGQDPGRAPQTVADAYAKLSSCPTPRKQP